MLEPQQLPEAVMKSLPSISGTVTPAGTKYLIVFFFCGGGGVWDDRLANNEGGEKSLDCISHLSDEGTAGDKSTVRDPSGILSDALIPSLLKHISSPLKFFSVN